MSDGTGLAEALLGLDGFRVLEVAEGPDEVVVSIETTATVVGCSACGTKALPHERRVSEIRDLACFGRPARLVWNKRRWRCPEPDCTAKTWTEASDQFCPRALLTRRAGVEVTRQVGENARPVAQLARELGVCWWTVMAAVIEYGTPLVDDPARVGATVALGVDETSWLAPARTHHTLYATGLVDLSAGILIDMVKGNTRADLAGWLSRQDPAWLEGITTVATDLAEPYRRGLASHLPHAQVVADPFHVVRAANRALDRVRARVQRQTTGGRGRRDDALYQIRKLLLAGTERLDEFGHNRLLLGLRMGDPDNEVLAAWLAKESVRDVYLTEDPAAAEVLLGKAIVGTRDHSITELAGLSRTLAQWREAILEHHRSGASNGPTEAMNLLVKKVKRCGHGFRTFEHYRLRVLLHTGGVAWPARPHPPRIRTRRHRDPYSNA